ANKRARAATIFCRRTSRAPEYPAPRSRSPVVRQRARLRKKTTAEIAPNHGAGAWFEWIWRSVLRNGVESLRQLIYRQSENKKTGASVLTPAGFIEPRFNRRRIFCIMPHQSGP